MYDLGVNNNAPPQKFPASGQVGSSSHRGSNNTTGVEHVAIAANLHDRLRWFDASPVFSVPWNEKLMPHCHDGAIMRCLPDENNDNTIPGNV